MKKGNKKIYVKIYICILIKFTKYNLCDSIVIIILLKWKKYI